MRKTEPRKRVQAREPDVPKTIVGESARPAKAEASALPSLLLASTGKPFRPGVVDHAIELARKPRSFVHVISIARIWGTGLGIQHPGLFPSKKEWQEQLEIVGNAVRDLKHAGLGARGGVIATRNASKVIAREAKRLGCRTIVVGWTPPPWWMAYLLQDEVWWLQRRAKVPVIVVPDLPAEESQ